MSKYAAFLRGINLGKRQVKMDELKAAFESLGFQNVKTILASGNVVFETEQIKEAVIIQSIEKNLLDTFGFEINVVVRNVDYLKELVMSDPFKGIIVTPETRLYVSLLPKNSKKTMEIPYESSKKDFRILCATEDELFSIVLANGKTTEAMTVLDKKFGKKITTRNWNTLKKISAL